eukprot:8930426-Lingulodinium_polyedra.AAC.1
MAIAQIDEENCFGGREWKAVRGAICQDCPGAGPWARWKHGQTSYMEQGPNCTTEKDRWVGGA